MYPLAELVTQNVVTVLSRVSVANGCNCTLDVERFKKGGNNEVFTPSPNGFRVVVGFLDDQLATDDDTPISYTQWIRPYWALVFVFKPEAANTPYDQLVDFARADISKALMADVTRGGYAQNTFIKEPVRFDDPNDATGILVNFDVHYRHLEGDPYQPQ